MDDKIKIECYECGLEISINRSYWEKEMADEYKKRICLLCGERGGFIL